MRTTNQNNLKVQGVATQEVYISMEEAFQALKTGLGFEDSYSTFLCVREGKLMRGEDVSRHGSPMYEYTEVSNNPKWAKLLLCFDTAVDAETFCKEKSALFLVMPEEDPSKFFMVSLIIQQLYREILAVADDNGGKLPNRAVFYADEFGTLPKIESAEMMFSASRSRRLSIVPIIQSLGQLEKNYGKEGAEIIVDNTQVTIFGGFAPNSETAQVMSKSGSVHLSMVLGREWPSWDQRAAGSPRDSQPERKGSVEHRHHSEHPLQ